MKFSQSKLTTKVDSTMGLTGLLPVEGKVEVLEYLAQKLSPEELQTISPQARVLLRDALNEKVRNEKAHAVTVKQVDPHLVAEFRICGVSFTVDNQDILASVPGDTLNKSRDDQAITAAGCGGRIATRSENLSVANSLIGREFAGNMSGKDAAFLRLYREGYVRDEQGGVFIEQDRVLDYDGLYGLPSPDIGALVIVSPDARSS